MRIEQNQDGKWCLYDGEMKLGEYDTEEEAVAAMNAQPQYDMADATLLAGADLKDLVAAGLSGEKEIQLAMPGHYIQNGREFDITAQDFADAERNFAAAQNPLAVDYEHNTFVKGAEAPAAGWIKKIVNRGEKGLYAVVAWTERAAGQIRAGEYKFISPVFFFNAVDSKSGKKIGTLLGPAGLTNFPLIQGMEPLTAKRVATKTKENSMNEFLNKLFLALGIEAGEDVSEESAIELIKAKMTADPPRRPRTVVPASILEVLELKDGASESEARGAIMALKFPADTVPRERYEDLEESLRARDIEQMVDRACRPGGDEMECKLYPHEREWAIGEARKDFEAMKAFIRRRPKILSLMAKLPSGKKDPARIDAQQEAINRQMGVSREVFLKHNGAASN